MSRSAELRLPTRVAAGVAAAATAVVLAQSCSRNPHDADTARAGATTPHEVATAAGSGSSGSTAASGSTTASGSGTGAAAGGPERASSLASGAATRALPAVLLVDANRVAHEKAAYRAGDPAATVAVNSLVKRATKDLALAPVSVTAKSQTPPSGDKHDYMSLSIYAWPNPKTADGLPYVIKDGDKNPNAADISDKADLVTVIDASQELAYAYYFTGVAVFAAKAASLLTTWFLDPATKMDPNLQYAQAVPGKSAGQAGGIIDTADLPKVVDAAGLLSGAPTWTSSDATALKAWFGAYLAWLRTSSAGRAEAATPNNHATWYDDQVIAYALYTGQPALAASVAQDAKTAIIARQVEADGKQPQELSRSTSWSYSTYNVEALARLAQLASRANVDLWSYRAPGGGSIRAAIDYVDSYIGRLGSWPYPQSSSKTLDYLPLALSAAAQAYGSSTYGRLAATAIAQSPTLYPAASLVFDPSS